MIIVFLPNGAEEIEAVTIVDVLRRGGVDAKSMSLSDDMRVTGSRGVGLVADLAWDDGVLAQAQALVVPGGMGGKEALSNDSRVLAHLRKANAEGRIVAAICAGPLVLAKAGVLDGRRAVCYPGLEDGLGGAEYVPGENAVVCRNVVTGTGPATAMEFALALLRLVAGRDVAEGVASGLLFASSAQ